MQRLLLVLALTVVGCPCTQTDVEYPPEGQPCTEGASQCLRDRPYACGGGVWRPIGTVTCTSAGVVCCVDRMTNVHACVSQDRCVELRDASTAEQ